MEQEILKKYNVWKQEMKGKAEFAQAEQNRKIKVEEAKAKLANGTLHVFDTSTFTVNGNKVTTCVKEFADGNKECIVTDGNVSYFAESLHRSAPYFDLAIDGISELSSK